MLRIMIALYGRLPVWQVMFDLGEKIWLQSYIRPVRAGGKACWP
jgi:hypothetical protein